MSFAIDPELPMNNHHHPITTNITPRYHHKDRHESEPHVVQPDPKYLHYKYADIPRSTRNSRSSDRNSPCCRENDCLSQPLHPGLRYQEELYDAAATPSTMSQFNNCCDQRPTWLRKPIKLWKRWSLRHSSPPIPTLNSLVRRRINLA